MNNILAKTAFATITVVFTLTSITLPAFANDAVKKGGAFEAIPLHTSDENNHPTIPGKGGLGHRLGNNGATVQVGFSSSKPGKPNKPGKGGQGRRLGNNGAAVTRH